MIRAVTIILMLIASISLHRSAEAASCVPAPSGPICLGKLCDSVGTTTIDSDQKNIIACLRDDSNNLVWKSTTGGSSGKDCVAYGQEVVVQRGYNLPEYWYSLNDGTGARYNQPCPRNKISTIGTYVTMSACRTLSIKDGSAFKIKGNVSVPKATWGSSGSDNYWARCDNGQIKILEDNSSYQPADHDGGNGHF